MSDEASLLLRELREKVEAHLQESAGIRQLVTDMREDILRLSKIVSGNGCGQSLSQRMTAIEVKVGNLAERFCGFEKKIDNFSIGRLKFWGLIATCLISSATAILLHFAS